MRRSLIYPELHNIYYQVSANVKVNFHSRSGDISNNGTEFLDLVACSPSPEDILLKRDEDKKIDLVLQVLRRYFKNVFTSIEREFIKQILFTEETPLKIANSLHLDFYTMRDTIYNKFNLTSKRLVDIFRKCGYICMYNIDFLPRLLAYNDLLEYKVKYRLSQKEKLKETEEKRKSTHFCFSLYQK